MRKLGDLEILMSLIFTIFTKPVGYSPRRENPATNKNIPSHPRVSLRFWLRNPAVTLVNSYKDKRNFHITDCPTFTKISCATEISLKTLPMQSWAT